MLTLPPMWRRSARHLRPTTGWPNVRLSRPRTSTIVALVAVLCAALAGIGFGPADAQTTSVLVGRTVPADQLAAIDTAAKSCPSLTGPRLAGQVMAASAFEPQATTTIGGSGVAGLTDAVWKVWAPAPDAIRSDPAANITALAHDMCDLAGHVAAAGLTGDPWQLSLAAFHSGLSAVTSVKAIPAAAVSYVDTVTAYANWYAEQTVFGGHPPTAAPSPSSPVAAVTAAPTVPDADVSAIVSAGHVCASVTPARVAAQLATASDFNANALSASGAQGIAQFRPDVWARYAPSATASPWDPATAIAALGATMCNLTAQFTGLGADPYNLALAAFEWGSAAVNQAGTTASTDGLSAFIQTVNRYATVYAADPRFGGPTTGASSSGLPSPTPTGAPTTTQPASPSVSPTSGSTAPPSTLPAGWKLTFSDEFGGAAGAVPDPSKWGYDTGGSGWGNSELEDYTKSTANAATDGQGHLAITATTAGAPGQTCWYGACTYTSARLVTLGHFTQQYGRFSARIQLPSGAGLWPAFWAMGDNISTAGWPQAGEMDVMNNLGSQPGVITAGLKGPDYSHFASDNTGTGFHTYSVDWYPDHVAFAVDGTVFSTIERPAGGWVFDHPFYLILDLAVGGSQAGDPNTTFPKTMLVDWVRVYGTGK